MILLLLACTPSGVIDVVDEPADSVVDSQDTQDTQPDTGDTQADPVGNALADAVTLDGMMGHLDALQAIADANEGTRRAYSDGYGESVQYVVDQLEDAGYTVVVTPFTEYSEEITEAKVTSRDLVLEHRTDFGVMSGSGSGSVVAPLVAVDVVVPPGAENSSTSGCQRSDFDDFPSGAVALLQRGSCTFEDKVDNAVAAGAVAVMIFNEGQAGRRDVVDGTLGGDKSVPVVGLSYEAGVDLLEVDTISLEIELEVVQVTDFNVSAATVDGDPAHGLHIGAHLDSVAAGPGINDNGSGTAFVLESALQLAQLEVTLERQVVFHWWGAEELGLIGSYAWISGQTDAQLDAIDAYLNFDMMGSPNGSAQLYDGDGSADPSKWDHPAGMPGGSDAIEAMFDTWFDHVDQRTSPVALGVPSDSYGFVYVGVPTGGLFSGADDTKSNAEAQAWGGNGGRPYDACYHLGCDTVTNIDPVLYEALGHAGAYVIYELATSDVPLTQGLTAPDRAAVRDTMPAPRGRVHPHEGHDHHSCGLPPATR